MTNRLLPCPFCAEENCAVRKSGNAVFIVCEECGTEGPITGRDEQAVQAWNTRPTSEAR